LNYDGNIRLPAEGRPIDALIAAYAARTLSAPFAAMVAAHLEIRPENRGYAAALEAVHGVFLEEVRPVPLAGRDRRLVNIFAAPEPEARQPAHPSGGETAALPRALRRLAGCDLAQLPWRSRGAGIKDVALAVDGGGRALFARVRPGRRLPLSPEEGLAAALVLEGAARDGAGEHVRGDILFAPSGTDNAPIAPVAAGEGDCVCFIVAESPAKTPGAFSRVLSRVIGG
jgi:putative transcriptional regulator